MRICFIDLPRADKKTPNIGIGYLASSLMEKGHHVKVIDLNFDAEHIEQRLAETSNYDIAGIHLKSFAIPFALEVSRMVKSQYLLWGGPHITVDGPNFLSQRTTHEIGVVGEGEQTIVELVDAIEHDKGLQDIKGIIYKDKDRIVVNPPRTFNADLDSLSYPNYGVLDFFEGTLELYPLITSRGCPYSCIFCCASLVSGKKWRCREPIKVIEELEFAKSRYNSTGFVVHDDNFSLDISRAKEICRLLIEHKINMEWVCSSGLRADRLDDELAALMKAAGCTQVALGIESIHPEIFPNIKKGENLDDIKRAIVILKRHKIRVLGFFIIGLPGDNLERTKSSIELAKNLGLSVTFWGHLSPYPGTQAWNWVREDAKMIGAWEEARFTVHGQDESIVFETNDFSREDRIQAYYLANVKSKCYDQIFKSEKSLMYNAFHILRLIMKYDAKNILSHLPYALRAIRSAWKLYRRVET
jgi:radical SAM superfamily enzyme YgiQ (UPF0313 family)